MNKTIANAARECAEALRRRAAFLSEPLIHSALRLHASALSSRRQQILSVASATPAVCLLERYSASTQIRSTSFNQRFLTEFLITELLAQFRHSDLYTGAGSPWDADGDKLT